MNDRIKKSEIVVLLILIFVVLYIIFYDFNMSEGSMSREEINTALKELKQITDSNNLENDRIAKLKILAKKVGAGAERTEIAAVTTYQERNGRVTDTKQNSISESELVQNINQALQTHMIMDSCKTANKQYKIALLAALIAVMSTFITWKVAAKEKSQIQRANINVIGDSEKMLSSNKNTKDKLPDITSENDQDLSDNDKKTCSNSENDVSNEN